MGTEASTEMGALLILYCSRQCVCVLLLQWGSVGLPQCHNLALLLQLQLRYKRLWSRLQYVWRVKGKVDLFICV